MSTFSADLDSAVGRSFVMLPAAIGFGMVSLAAQAALFVLLPKSVSGAVWWITPSLSHGLFIVLMAALPLRARFAGQFVRSVALAGALLALPILAFATLDVFGGQHSCAEGRAVDISPVPDLPWLWIGWAILTYFALPMRLIGLVSGVHFQFVPPWRRIATMAFFAPGVWLFGVAFETPDKMDCVGPQEGMGFMEGGMIIMPLLGLFLFATSYAMAILSRSFVRDEA